MKPLGRYVREFTTYLLLSASLPAAQGSLNAAYPQESKAVYSQAQGQEPTDKAKYEAINVDTTTVEKELRKWGPWVNELVENDYTDGKRTKPVAITLENRKRTSFYVPGFMEYRSGSNVIRIPKTVNTKYEQRIKKSIHHEIVHYLLDKEGVKGLVNLPDYRGLSASELLALSEAAMNLQENRNYMNARQEAVSRSLEINRFEYAVEIYKNLRETLEQTSEYLEKEPKDIIKEFGKNELNKVSEAEKIAGRQISQYFDILRIYLAIGEDIDSIEAKITQTGERIKKSEPTEGALQEILEMEKAAENLVREYASRRLQNSYDLNSAYYDLMRIKTGYDFYDDPKTKQDSLKTSNMLRDSILRLLDTRMYGSKILYELADGRVSKDFIDAEQFLGDVAGNILTFYVGESNFDAPAVTNELLDALDSMTYKGEKVFGDSIQRYRLALKLKERGYSPEVAQRIASKTEFEIDGVRYSFHENGFRIVGAPHIEGIPTK